MGARSEFDVIGVLDALYTLEQSADAWVLGLLSAAERFLSQGRGVGLARYDIRAREKLSDASIVGLGVPDGWHAVGVKQHRDPALADNITQTYRSVVSAGAQQMLKGLALREPYMASMRNHGVGDQWLINGLSADGRGAALYLFARAECTFSPEQRRLLRALAFHVGTAYRLHRRFARDGLFGPVEAILGPQARIEHTTPWSGKRPKNSTGVRVQTWRESPRSTRRRPLEAAPRPALTD